MQAAESSDKRRSPTFFQFSVIWLVIVFGIPYIILGIVSGFGESFRSGEASTFLCGALVAAIGENLIDQIKYGFPNLKKPRLNSEIISRGDLGFLPAIPVIISLGLLGWNLYFAVQDKSLHYPPIDWVQVVAFAFAAHYLLVVRLPIYEYYNDI